MSRVERLLDEHACPSDIVITTSGAVAATATARSYLGDGRCACWSPPVATFASIAVDAEVADRPVPQALARRFGVTEPVAFWLAWTAVEVACKLSDVPVLVWLRTRGFKPDAVIASRTLWIGNMVVSCGAVCEPSGQLGSTRRTSRRRRSFARTM